MRLLTAPTAEPVTLAEAKLAARISDGDPLEPMLAGLITAARQVAQQQIGRPIMQQIWRHELADWPAADAMLYGHQPTAVAIAYWTGSAWQSLSGGAFVFYPQRGGAGVAPVGGSWPALGSLAGGPRVQVDVTSGEATAADVPECIKLFIKALVAHWAHHPEAAAAGSLQQAPYLAAVLDPERLWV